MARRSNSPAPPPVMTWGKATPLLTLAVIFDLVALFFHFFWLAGPALAALYCTAETAGALATWTLGLLGTKTAAAACAAGAGIVGTAAIEITIPFGVIMALAVGLFGWLTIILWMFITNSRIFKEEAGAFLWIIGGLVVDEAPIIGALPALTVAVWRMYHTQIKRDKVAMKKYLEEQARLETQERQRQIMEHVRVRAMEEERMASAEAANDEEYGEEEIPQKQPRAA